MEALTNAQCRCATRMRTKGHTTFVLQLDSEQTQHQTHALTHSLVPREAGVRALEAADLAGVAARPVGLAGQPLAIRWSHASRLRIDALIV